MTQEWRLQANCRDTGDPDRWFPPKGEDIRPAVDVCRSCPVSAPCLDFAVSTGQAHGIWGGLTPVERLALREGPRPGHGRHSDVSPCGTYAAYVRHRRWGETPCGPCREANRRYTSSRRRPAPTASTQHITMNPNGDAHE